MAKRTTVRTFLPWVGGLNTSLDASLLQNGELTIADNVYFDTQFSKKKRDGINHDWDNASFLVTSRASSGTTRTLTGTFSNTGIIVGDRITISGAGNSAYNGSFMTVTAISGTDLSYTAGSSLTETSTPETTAVWGNKVIEGIDYWIEASGAKSQVMVIILDNGAVYYLSSGNRNRITDAGTAWTVTSGIANASMQVFNNKVFVAVTGTGNKMKVWDGTTLSNSLSDVSNAPLASILMVHQDRLLCDDKTNKDRLHFCQTGDHTVWNGAGDSGAYDIGIGDGDPTGIAGISPPFRGDIFVGKRNRLYRISGAFPEVQIDKVTDGLGFLSHKGIVAVDTNDVMFVSNRGIHSLAATDTYGSFDSTFLSKDIQRSFIDDWTESRKPYIKGAYIASLNSVGFAVSDEEATTNNAIYFYNIELKAWYRWPNVSCEAFIPSQDADKRRVYLGGNNGRVSKTQHGTIYDISEYGVNTAIAFKVATGRIYPDGNAVTSKGFKKIGLIYKPQGSSQVIVKAKVDNFSNQILTFQADSEVYLLGSTFILGVSPLASDFALAPYILPVDGFGRGIILTIEQSGTTDEVDIIGFLIEYEPAEWAQETRLGDTN